jgi:hypothetical protein
VILQYKILILFILFAANSVATWYFAADHYGNKAAQLQIKQDKQSAALVAEKDANILKGAIQHELDQATITFLAAESGKLQVHIPAVSCDNTKGSANKDGTSRLLSARVDEEFAVFQTKVTAIIQRADQLNIDAIQANTANK